MDAQSLVASAVVNIGLALIILSLFSVLKKRHSNAPIYYARLLSTREKPVPSHNSLTLSRFCPSISWIRRAYRVDEDKILHIGGLDALVIIRLFKFGIKYFAVCSVVGVVILVPINYYSEDEPSQIYHSMYPISISNVKSGSNWLWVHFTCLWFITLYGLYLLYKEYDDILVKRMQQLKGDIIRHRPDQFTVLVRGIPLPSQPNSTYGSDVSEFFSRNYPGSYKSYKMLQVSRKELPVAFVTFNSRQGAALAAQSQPHSNPILWTTEMAPEPRDVSWTNLAIPFKILWLRRIGAFLAASLLTIFFTFPVTVAISMLASFVIILASFVIIPGCNLLRTRSDMRVNRPGLGSIVTGYLPSAILKGFMFLVPCTMLKITKFSGSISRSKRELKASSMVFYFLVGNVFFLCLISGSLLDEIGASFAHPEYFLSHLASAVSAQADFFVTYILTDGLSGFSWEILQPGLLLWDGMMSCIFGRGTDENPYLYSLPYFRVIPFTSLSILIGMVYAIVAPLLLPVLVVYFCLGYIVYINQIQDVYVPTYETCGQYWPYIHQYIFFGIILMQMTMIGLFGLKSKPVASLATVPLLLITIMFNEYCKSRFLPSFRLYPIQIAVENDLDENARNAIDSENAIHSYRSPQLPAKGSMDSERNQPLLPAGGRQ
ncbi:CSC1-like protein At3g54510 [Tripterygium wilfordii]|uniref:CSC1-like protein At3g54510 n=1 Tax=Tripterygium wilfordii TaxID=458696 RepID=UPI0018F81616|nr:CSC1-like protein At3g54510 [Tripterygium wilfordii]